MTTSYRIFDQATGDELFPSDSFVFDTPSVGAEIADSELASRFGGDVIIRRIEEQKQNAGSDDRTHVFVASTGTKVPEPVTESAAATDRQGGGGVEGIGSDAGRDGGMLTEG